MCYFHSVNTRIIECEFCTFLRRTMSEDRISALDMLSIVKSMVNDLPKFNGNLIDLFA